MLDLIDAATKRTMMAKAVALGSRAAWARPDLAARAMGWAAFGSPRWPWERRRPRSRWERVTHTLLSPTRRQRRDERFWNWRLMPSRQRQLRRRSALWQLMAAAVVGGALAYFFDPVMGNRRRKYAVQRTGRMLRRSVRGLSKAGRKMSGDISGRRQAIMHAGDARETLDDATLAHKVESVLFRNPHVPKGRININAEHGVVVLRGELEHSGDIRGIEQSVRGIEGVQQVRSLLHLAGDRS